ncbi:MAG: DUF2231 domain-containing protein [Nocardioidaceae bacterium]|jgi:uncharacterized membrane protein
MSNPPAAVTLVERIESNSGLDPLVERFRPLAEALVANPTRSDALRGKWLGHALHPLMTDLPIGFWTSALVLDLAGGPSSRDSATRLVGLGILSALPTALTGWAEWATIGQREQRVGVVHANANVVALVLFTASWRARRRGADKRGKSLALAAAAVLGFGGYLGGHLVSARKVSSRHPVFELS